MSASPIAYHWDHIHLRSRDPVAAARFYVETFGARETDRVGPEPVSRVILDIAGLTVFIERAPDDLRPAAEPPHLGVEHLGLGVADIDAAVADLQGRGIVLVSGITQMRPDLRVAFLDGPDGVRIEILERKPA